MRDKAIDGWEDSRDQDEDCKTPPRDFADLVFARLLRIVSVAKFEKMEPNPERTQNLGVRAMVL